MGKMVSPIQMILLIFVGRCKMSVAFGWLGIVLYVGWYLKSMTEFLKNVMNPKSLRWGANQILKYFSKLMQNNLYDCFCDSFL